MMRRAAVWCGLVMAVAMGCRAELPAAYEGPKRVDLSGVWEFKLDAGRVGEKEQWYGAGGGEGWQPLAVPGSYNEQLAKDAGRPELTDTMRFYKGVGWYRRTFAAPGGEAGMAWFLHLSGTVLRHKVWVNGRMVGASERPYLEEAYDVSSALKKDGPNTVMVEVDNSLPALGVPDNYWHGWWDDGGLIRPVYLEERPTVHGQSYVSTKMAAGGGWVLGVETKVDGAADGVRVGYELRDKAGKVVWRQDSRGMVGAGIKSEAKVSGVGAWSPETPVLYTLVTTVTAAGGGADVTRVRVGFRQIEVKGTRILLNGKAVMIRGLSRQQFLAGKGMSLSVAEDRRDIEDLKDLGANFVRLAHYSQSQDVYDACDELGLMVWTEIPAWQSNIASLTSEDVWERQARPQLEGMVEQHRNHASVVFWSVGNEIPTQSELGATYVAKAIGYVKSLDATRLVTFASDRREGDKAFGPADVVAVNEYFGWYYGKFDDVGPMLDKVHRTFPGKPVLVTEFGQDAVAGWDKATAKEGSKDYSYARQAEFLQRHLEQIFAPEKRGFVAGGVVWVYNDFPDPHRVGGDHPDAAKYRNNKGVVTMDRTKKPGWEVVRRFFVGLQGR